MSVLGLVGEDEAPVVAEPRKPSVFWAVAFAIVMLVSAAMAADGLGFFG